MAVESDTCNISATLFPQPCCGGGGRVRRSFPAVIWDRSSSARRSAGLWTSDSVQRPAKTLLTSRCTPGPRAGGGGAALSGRGPGPALTPARAGGRGGGGAARRAGGAERERSGRGRERSRAGRLGGSGMAARGSAGDAALRCAAEQWLLWDKVRGGGSGLGGGRGLEKGQEARLLRCAGLGCGGSALLLLRLCSQSSLTRGCSPSCPHPSPVPGRGRRRWGWRRWGCGPPAGAAVRHCRCSPASL